MSYKLTPSTSILRIADNAFIPADLDNKDYVEYLAWLDAGNTPEPLPEPEPVDPVPLLVAALQSHMDAAAKELGYDDLKTAITYRGDPNPRFAAEAEGFFLWRSAIWTTAYAMLGSGNIPETIEAAVALMPTLNIEYT